MLTLEQLTDRAREIFLATSTYQADLGSGAKIHPIGTHEAAYKAVLELVTTEEEATRLNPELSQFRFAEDIRLELADDPADRHSLLLWSIRALAEKAVATQLSRDPTVYKAADSSGTIDEIAARRLELYG